MILKLYQLKDSKLRDYSFLSYELVKDNGFSLDDYECVWEENIDADTNLDEIYANFQHFDNDFIPDAYKARSLSAGDIIDLEGEKYYIDFVGFTKII